MAQSNGPDTTIQVEVIRQLAESVRQQTDILTQLQLQFANMAERLARIEANQLHEEVDRLRDDLRGQKSRIDALMQDKDRRDGALGAADWLQKSVPWAIIAGAIGAVTAWIKAH